MMINECPCHKCNRCEYLLIPTYHSSEIPRSCYWHAVSEVVLVEAQVGVVGVSGLLLTLRLASGAAP